jgi:hypothetical protein
MDTEARFHERIHDIAERAEHDRAAFDPPADPPDPDRAMAFLNEGAGPAISIYVESRTGGLMVHFPPEEYHALEGAMNTYLDLYAACYGVDLDAEWTLREAAELLLDTNNVRDVAVMLTHVPADEKPAND